jgi:hypothetical protein
MRKTIGIVLWIMLYKKELTLRNDPPLCDCAYRKSRMTKRKTTGIVDYTIKKELTSRKDPALCAYRKSKCYMYTEEGSATPR